MPLTGEYAPSTSKRTRDQVELYERSGGTEGTTHDGTGLPVVILTTLGAKSGKLRKTALMRVEHDGVYAVVASQGGTPQNPVWYHNIKAHPLVELQDGPVRKDYLAREVTGDEKALWRDRADAAYPPTPSTAPRPTGTSRSSSSSPSPTDPAVPRTPPSYE